MYIFTQMQFKEYGNIRIDVERDNVDMLSLSAHKFYGPKGVRSTVCKKWDKFQKNTRSEDIRKRIKGQGQKMLLEQQDFGCAIELAYKNIEKYNKKLIDLREYYISNAENRIKDIKINGDRKDRLPGNANVSFKGIEGESLLLKLDAVRNMHINRFGLQFWNHGAFSCSFINRNAS